jgi:5-methylcytosine-specific restriction protein B
MATKSGDRDLGPILAGAQKWIASCLIDDGSVLSSGSLWTSPLVEEVRSAFVDHPDAGKDDFLTKLKGQLKSASADAQCLMAEMLWALLLFPSNIQSETKRWQTREVWQLSGRAIPENHPMLSDAVVMGVGSGGPGFNNHRWREVVFLIALTGNLKQRSRDDRRRLLTDYESFMGWIDTVPQEGHRQFRHMLRYFCFPNRVERMSSNRDRQAILVAFGVATKAEVRGWSDRQLDDGLSKLRNSLQEEHPTSALDFYEKPLIARWKSGGDPDPIVDGEEEDAAEADLFAGNDAALNCILYGPPGTGKTYVSLRQAVTRAEGSAPSDDAEVKARFDALRSQRRIEFVTFHQSYSYEDFIEGIRPDLETEGSAIRYECRDGIFKKLALRALYDCLEPRIAQEAAEFDTRWQALLRQIESDPERAYESIGGRSSYRLAVSRSRNVNATNTLDPTVSKLIFSRANMLKVFTAHRAKPDVTTTAIAETLGVGSHSSLGAVLFRELKHVKAVPSSTAHEAIVNDDDRMSIARQFLQDGKNSQYRLRQEGARRQYVLVIDEINRGNISKIFGELITLIEPDKRIGMHSQLTAELPYSQEQFGVPPNLHVIGTMNTADKSIALVDVALRRRFEFDELMPRFDQETCPGFLEDMQAVLNEMNRRIQLRKDRDHQIGHAYFRTVGGDREAFDRVFNRRILPLLHEYFYNDWEGLRYVLGETGEKWAFIERVKTNDKEPKPRNAWQWSIDAVWPKPTVTALDWLKSNYGFGKATG